MKAIKALAAGLAILASLAACTLPPPDDSPSPSPKETASPSALPSSPSPSPTLSPEPSFLPDTDIPDIVIGEEPAADSSRTVYEDEKSVYILVSPYGSGCLYRIDKLDNKAEIISHNCGGFTILGGKIFYIDYDSKSDCYNMLKSFDTSSHRIKQIIKLKYDIYNVAAYNDRLYFAYAPEHNEELEADISNLYSIKPSGKGRAIVAKDVDTFCIYKDLLFYTEPGYPDSSPLYMCALDKAEEKRHIDWTWNYTICDDKLVFNRDQDAASESLCEIDLSTQKKTNIPGGWYYFVPFGQYLISVDTGDSGVSCLQAFDINTGKKYDLLELGIEDYTLSSSQNRAYISWDDEDSLHIAEILINDGKATLSDQEFVVSELYSFEYKQPSSGTVIIASSSGYIHGGYSDGKWLTHGETALYCGGSLTFNECNLKDCIGTVKSSGIQYYEGDGGSCSRTCDMPPETYDWSGDYYLSIPDDEGEYNYSKNPLCYSYLYYGITPPKIEAVKDTSEIQPIIQGIVDKHLGKGNVKTKVRVAVKADIDGDGKKETVVNADNNAELLESTYGDIDEEADNKYWFCFCCIIESDGSVIMIDEYYAKPYTEDDEYVDMAFMYVQNIIDIDGDGSCEIVLDWSAWETGSTVVYKYNGKKLTEKILFGFGS